MVLNEASGVVKKYHDILLEAGIVKENSQVLNDPYDDSCFKDEYRDLIVLQQGGIRWNHSKLSHVKYVITLSLHIFNEISHLIPTFLIPFPIKHEIFNKKIPWQERSNNLYYHGRIIPGKLPLLELEKILKAGYKITLRGPIGKNYWSNEDSVNSEIVEYKEEIKKLDIEFLPPENDPIKLADELNHYKYYFTLSCGEAFNVALQEAIACGTIPFVRHSGAYWWADHLLLNFSNIDQFIQKFDLMKKQDYLEDYSSLISRELIKRYSIDKIKESFEDQKKILFS